jgi:hypothetical protein
MTKKWKIKVNGTKSVQVTFTIRGEMCPSVSLNENPSSKRCQIFRAIPGSQTKVETIYIYQAKTTWTSIGENILSTRQ